MYVFPELDRIQSGCKYVHDLQFEENTEVSIQHGLETCPFNSFWSHLGKGVGTNDLLHFSAFICELVWFWAAKGLDSQPETLGVKLGEKSKLVLLQNHGNHLQIDLSILFLSLNWKKRFEKNHHFGCLCHHHHFWTMIKKINCQDT